MIKIGIDPDCNKSGCASKQKTTGLILNNLKFFDLFEQLKEVRELYTDVSKVMVYIEAGWLNRSNWHKVQNGSAAINSQIGQRTGANHETGKKIVEMCEYLGLPYKLVKPTRKKVDAKLFQKLTGYIGRTNQEQRDAAMLII